MPQIEVTFNIDVNGILSVSAKDKATGKENKTTVEKSGALSKEEIERMKRDAEAHAADDKKRREVIEMKNRGEQVVYQTEKDLREHGDKVPGDVRSSLEGALNNAKDALKSDEGDRIKRALENLEQARTKLGEEIYKSAGATADAAGAARGPEASTDRGTAGAGAGADGKKKDDDVIDAEYEVKE